MPALREPGMTRATVLIPTHDHAETLSFSVRSVLVQTHSDLEVIIIGDGVTDDVRAVAVALVADDPRVTFLDRPKGPNHGEIYRHEAILGSKGDVIAYLCDDDLLLPSHLADLVTLLETHDFVQCLNGRIDPEGRMFVFPGDLADPEFIASICDPDLGFNFVGITGTAHTREYYDRTGEPWQTTPAGEFPDQHQWRRMFASVQPRGATSSRMTVLQFPTHLDGRYDWSAEERGTEIRRWVDVVAAPDCQDRIDALVRQASWRQLVAATKRELLQDRALRRGILPPHYRPAWRRAFSRLRSRLRGTRWPA